MPRKTPKAEVQKKPIKPKRKAKKKRETLEERFQRWREEGEKVWREYYLKQNRGRTGRVSGIYLAMLQPPKEGAENLCHKALLKPYEKMSEREYAAVCGEEELRRSKEIYASMQAQKAAARNERRRMKRWQMKLGKTA